MPEAGHQSGDLSLDEVRKVARLSRLALDDATLGEHARRLTSVLHYIERLGRLKLEGVEPLIGPADEDNRFDEDEPREPLPNEALMKMAPDAHPPFVKAPKVLGDAGGA